MLEGTVINPHIHNAQNLSNEIMEDFTAVCPANQLPVGWALQKGRKCTRFTADQKQFLLEHFDKGAQTNKKVDPKWLATQMRKEQKGGNPRFSPSEWLSWQQIASFFSRTSRNRIKSALQAAHQARTQAPRSQVGKQEETAETAAPMETDILEKVEISEEVCDVDYIDEVNFETVEEELFQNLKKSRFASEEIREGNTVVMN